MLRGRVPPLARVSCKEERRRKKWSWLIGLVIYSEDCYMEQIESEMSCVIFCDCMARAAFLFRTYSEPSFSFSCFLSVSHTSRPIWTLSNNWLFKSQGKVLCCASLFYFNGHFPRKPCNWNLQRIPDYVNETLFVSKDSWRTAHLLTYLFCLFLTLTAGTYFYLLYK